MPAIIPFIPAIIAAGSAVAGGVMQNDANNSTKDAQKKALEQQAAAQSGVKGQTEQQQAFVNALGAQNGIANQSQVFDALKGVADGTGPNPAQAQLNNSTGQNVANQGALMAGQRGSSANPGLIARQVAQQGAATQQQAAGQGAALQAAQSLNALSQMGGLANQQVGQQGQALGLLTQAGLTNQGQQITGAQNTAGNAATQQKATTDMLGGLTKAAGTAATVFGTGNNKPSVDNVPATGGSTNVPGTAPTLGVNTTFDTPTFASGGPVSAVGRHFAKGGTVSAMVSPGERYLSPDEVKKVAEGKKSPMKAGERIPGEAKVKGAKDSYANDTVSKTLQSGGIVLPRHVTQAKDAPEKAAAFVRAIMAKQGLKK